MQGKTHERPPPKPSLLKPAAAPLLGGLTDKHLQCVEQRLRIKLTLIDGRRHGAALEQDMDRLPGRADGALDGEGYFSGHVDVLADESEIGRTLWNGGRHVAAAPGEPDVVDVGHV